MELCVILDSYLRIYILWTATIHEEIRSLIKLASKYQGYQCMTKLICYELGMGKTATGKPHHSAVSP